MGTEDAALHRSQLVGTEARPTGATARRTLLGYRAVLDEQAKSSYREHLRELEQELDEVTEWGDPVRAANLREEMDFLTDELAAAVGLGGWDRQTGSEAERARVNITRGIRSALGRNREHSAAVADRLDSTVHIGTFCSSSPDPRAPIN
jgi:hypothetical protein